MTTPDRPVEGLVEVTAACVVLDIEGTTSPTSAVLGGLYDYARPRLGPWIARHGDEMSASAARGHHPFAQQHAFRRHQRVVPEHDARAGWQSRNGIE